MKRATPRFSAATFRSMFLAPPRSDCSCSGDSGSMPSKKPSMSGVLPSSLTSEASILMCRQAGLSVPRLLLPWMSDTVGPRPHAVPDVVSST